MKQLPQPPMVWSETWASQNNRVISLELARLDSLASRVYTLESASYTASRAIVSDANGALSASSVTATELGYLSGATSAVQTQINAKLASSAVSAFGLTLIDDADASAARTTLGLGDAALATIGTSGDTVPKCNTANTYSAAQSVAGAIATPWTLNRTDANGNVNIRYQNTGGSVYAGAHSGPTYSVGGSADLATAANRWASFTSTSATFAGTVASGIYTVATLPTGSQGMRAFVTDANATTFASVVAGGGTNKVPVYHDGTNWRIG